MIEVTMYHYSHWLSFAKQLGAVSFGTLEGVERAKDDIGRSVGEWNHDTAAGWVRSLPTVPEVVDER